MLDNTEIEASCHAYARIVAESLVAPDKKQLRFNDIVRVAMKFYPRDPFGGVRELVQACDKSCDDLYDAKNPWWQTMEQTGEWMLPGAVTRIQTK